MRSQCSKCEAVVVECACSRDAKAVFEKSNIAHSEHRAYTFVSVAVLRSSRKDVPVMLEESFKMKETDMADVVRVKE